MGGRSNVSSRLGGGPSYSINSVPTRPGSSFPNYGPTNGVPIGPNYNPNFNPSNPYSNRPGSGMSPVGNTGRDMYGRPIAGQPTGPGNQAGGGSASSQASTEQFNQFLQQFMQGGGMQQMMQGMQGGPQWNPYMSLINPNGASYKPPSVGGGTPSSGGSGNFGPGTTQPLPPVPSTWNPGDAPWGSPAWRPGMPGGPTAPTSFAPPTISGGPGGFQPKPSMQVGGWQDNSSIGGSITPFNPNETDIQRATAAGNTEWLAGKQAYDNQQSGLSVEGAEFTDGQMYNAGVRPPTGGPVLDPMLTPWPGSAPPPGPDGGSPYGGSGQQVNEYGMPTGNFGGLQNVPGQYNGSQYNQFGGQQPGMIGEQNGMFNDPAFLRQLQMGLGGMANLADAGSADVYGKFATDTQNLLGRKADRDVADLRARYGMSGGSSLGSAAALAEGNFRAENSAQVGTALGNINLQERGLNLQSRGQDLQNYLGSRGLDINQLGMMSQNNQFGADLGLRGAMSNQNAQQNWQQLMSQNNQFMNQFNQNDSQFGANFGQQAANMNNQAGLQNQSQMNNYGLGVAGIGQQQQQMQQQQQQFMMNQMMQAYMAQAGWNTPQAENVEKPSSLSQWIAAGGTAIDWYNKIKEARG